LSQASVRGAVAALLLLTTPLATGAAEIADLVGKAVATVQLFREGVPTTDRSTLDLIETRAGQPFSMRQVRESVIHLFNLGEFADVRVSATEDARGVALRYDLVPLRTVAGVEIRGSLGRPPDELLDAIARRFGSVVRPDQIPDAVRLLESLYHASGRFAARITPEVSSSGQLAFVVDQGPLARLGRIEVNGVPEGGRGPLLVRLGLDEGAVYDPVDVEQRLAEYEADVRGRRYYDADFRHEVTPSADGRSVAMLLDIQTGSPVTILFEGDAVPDAPLAELVPVAREGSIDEDLLEDSSLRVETHLRSLGYRDARVTHLRLAELGVLSVVFTVDRGAEFQVQEVSFEGHQALSVAELRELFGVASGTPLVQSALEQGVRALAAQYAQLGHRAVQIRPATIELADTLSGVVPVSLAVEIVEGPRTMVGAVGFEGSTAFSAAQLGALVDVVPGVPYYGPRLAADADAVLAHYLNEGYETTQVEVLPRFDETGATADVTFVVREGPQVLVDHVLVVGNRQIASSAIRRELALRPGQPLGRDEVDETRRRLTALGLFRRIELRQFSHGGWLRRRAGGDAAATRHTGRRCRRAAGARAAWLLRDRSAQPLGQEPLDRSVHAGQSAPRGRPGCRGAAIEPGVQRVSRAPELPRAARVSAVGRSVRRRVHRASDPAELRPVQPGCERGASTRDRPVDDRQRRLHLRAEPGDQRTAAARGSAAGRPPVP
jgi:outer membrane protein assembly factor BamA